MTNPFNPPTIKPFNPPKTHYDAIVLGLKLAIVATTDKKAKEAVDIVEHIAMGLSEDDIRKAKIEVDEWVHDASMCDKTEFANTWALSFKE